MRRHPLLLVLALIAASCGGGTTLGTTQDTTSTTAVTTTTVPPTTTTTTSTATTSTTTSTTSTTTTTVPETTTTLDPVAACRAYSGELGDLLNAIADRLTAGAAVAGDLATEAVTAEEGAGELEAIAAGFTGYAADLVVLGEPPAPLAEAAGLVVDAVDLFAKAYERQAQGARDDDQAAIDEGVVLIDQGAALLAGFGDALRPCDPSEGGDVLATPSDTDIEVYLRTGEILLADTAYAELGPDALIAGGQAACRGLAEGGVEAAIAAALAGTPAEGAPFLTDEQNLVLFLVTRGVPLWCPQLVDDEEAFTAEVVTAIVDIFLEE